MFNKTPVVEVHFIIAHYCIVIILKIEKKHTVDILYVNVKFQIFYFLVEIRFYFISCFFYFLFLRSFNRKRGNEGLSSAAKELLVSLLILYFYNVFK